MILANHGIVSSSGGAISYDADAFAFMTAASITDNTQKTAINTLVTDLKTYNIWTKMKALYPFVGGSAASHKFNLKDPRDLDAAYRLTFNGGWTHSSTGALPNGTTAYANLFLTPATDVTSLSHLSYYSRVDSTNGEMFYSQDDFTSYTAQFYISGNKTSDVFSMSNLDTSRVVNSSASTLGMYIASRTSSTSLKGYKNGSLVGTDTSISSGSLPNIPIYLGASNYRAFGGTTTIYYGNKECAFASIGNGLTDTEASNLYTAVQNYNTTLNRNV